MASLPFHPGEVHLHKQLFSHNKRKGVDTLRDNPTLPGHYLPSFSSFLSAAPLYAVGTVDDGGKPWSGIWSNGVGGMAPVVGRDLLGLKVDFAKGDVTDPVLATLISGRTEEVRELKEGSAGIVVKAEGKGRMISLLAIDLEKRRRVKLAGRVLVAAVGIEVGAEGEEQKMGLQVVIRVEQCLGNCPKYLNSKSFVPVASKPELVSAGTVLSQKALNIVRDADMFFISSRVSRSDRANTY
jgi:predicted pyridoxine 5'-phosphate oxidase superfamily flavin-nucleotide-binding protein